jgi:sulfur relay (sulfurtransferase) complex TusBCD TusD component (DsrE family)
MKLVMILFTLRNQSVSVHVCRQVGQNRGIILKTTRTDGEEAKESSGKHHGL